MVRVPFFCLRPQRAGELGQKPGRPLLPCPPLEEGGGPRRSQVQTLGRDSLWQTCEGKLIIQ